ncbi:MAG: hypothetical protein ACOYU4_04530 [Thermodesulfobacteriota bacterium]
MGTKTTGKDLVDHWSWAAEKGLMNKNSALSLKTACANVLSVIDDWESIDITSIDVEDVITRFKNIQAKKYKPQSLETYAKRFRNAFESYIEYIQDPGAWKPASRQIQTTNSSANFKSKKKSSIQKDDDQIVSQQPSGRGLIDYPFPLREGVTVRLMLPRDITVNEVKRLNAFMSTLAVDFNE